MKKKPLKLLTPNDVSVKDWLAMKPYDAPIYNYDAFYIKQCQTVYGFLVDEGAQFRDWDISNAQLKELSCQIVSYFEDFIVEIGIWQTFIETNKELYGYCLPFYDLSDYDETYINVEDIAFLIWHYVTKYSEEEYIINPDHDVIMSVSVNIFELFEDVMEEAPAIDYYDKFFTIKDDENYFVFKSKMKWFSTESYLLGVDLGKKLKVADDEATQQIKNTKSGSQYMGIVLYSIIEQYLYQKRSSLSALNAPEWFAKIAKCSDTRREEIVDLTYWIEGKFFLKERQAKHFIFEHILTKVTYKVRINSFKKNKDMLPSPTDAYVMHLIRWHEEYLFSGMMFSQQMTEMELKKYRTEPLSASWILPEKSLEMMRNTTGKMQKAFLEFFKSPLAVFDNSGQLDKANKAYMDYYREKLIAENNDTTSEAVSETVRKFKEILGKGETNLEKEMEIRGIGESLGLFFIEGVGTYICNDIKETIRDLKGQPLQGHAQADLFVTFINGYIPPICTYLLQTYGSKNLKFPTSYNTIDVVKHLPFYWRMNSPEEFDRVYPMMTLVDKSHFED